MIGATLDSGALIAFERNRRSVVSVIMRLLEVGGTLWVPAGVVSEVWRDGSRQARTARLLASPQVEVVSLDDHEARATGQLMGTSSTSDVVDASVVRCAQLRSGRVLTSDPDDLLAIDPSLEVYRC